MLDTTKLKSEGQGKVTGQSSRPWEEKKRSATGEIANHDRHWKLQINDSHQKQFSKNTTQSPLPQHTHTLSRLMAFCPGLPG